MRLYAFNSHFEVKLIKLTALKYLITAIFSFSSVLMSGFFNLHVASRYYVLPLYVISLYYKIWFPFLISGYITKLFACGLIYVLVTNHFILGLPYIIFLQLIGTIQVNIKLIIWIPFTDYCAGTSASARGFAIRFIWSGMYIFYIWILTQTGCSFYRLKLYTYILMHAYLLILCHEFWQFCSL